MTSATRTRVLTGITTTGTASVQMTGTALTIPAGSQVAVKQVRARQVAAGTST